MTEQDSEFWARINRARDKLAGRFLDHPDVSLIDIGYPMEQGSIKGQEITLRIHVRERWVKANPEERVAFPEQVDGFPVAVVPGEYSLEDGI